MAKKKLPKVLALLDEDMCTGCEACLVVCPVDCISTVPGPRHEGVFSSLHHRSASLHRMHALPPGLSLGLHYDAADRPVPAKC